MELGKRSRTKKTWKNFLFGKPACCLNFDYVFYQLGMLIGKHPVISMISALLLCAICSLGMINWVEEVDDVELFMPYDSPIRRDSAWVEKHFSDDLRIESIIVEADNVLDPAVLAAIAKLEGSVKNINVSGHSWKDICARYLTWFENEEDASNFNISAFSDMLDESLKTTLFQNDCIYQSLLKVWTHTDDSYAALEKMSKDNVLHDVTNALHNKRQKNVLNDIRPLLSGIRHNPKGKVIGAKATILNWMLKKADNYSPEWELEFIKQALNVPRSLPKSMKIYAVSTRSYNDILHQVLANNMTVLFAGFSLIIIYVVFMMGKCNPVEQRIYLSLFGVAVVGMAIVASYGFSFMLGFRWGPIHPILPFLLLGIGVDNTFIIVQCLDNLNKKDIVLSVPEQIACAFQKAGVSVTVTSLTDALAFAIGTTTVMPFLRSFCVFAATGILFLYIFVLFFFGSWLTIDEYRAQKNRDACCFCIYHRHWSPNKCSRRHIQKYIFSKWIGPFLMKAPVKICVLLLTALVFATNIWCVLQVEQKFDPVWYLNPDSYPIQYNNKLNEYFPLYGKRAGIYLSGINYFKDQDQLNNLAEQLSKNPYLNTETMDCWFVAFHQWMETNDYGPENEEEYKAYLTEYLLLTKEGQAYVKDIKFNKVPFNDYNITTSQIPIQYIVMNTTLEQVEAMQSVQDIVKSIKFTGGNEKIVAYSPDYVSWTANKIIGEELLRNLAIIIGAVVVVTILLIQNLITTTLVNLCVILTVVDLIGSMYWLHLTIEISTSIMVLLCAGLSVDYAAHVGQEFTRLPGTKNERAIQTLSRIGPAVFNGGISTFLAMALLGTSQSYLFTTFFKLFTGVVVFGLYHSLIFLPVVLSICGPSSKYETEILSNPIYSTAYEMNGYFMTRNVNDTKKRGNLSSVQPTEEVNEVTLHELKLAPLPMDSTPSESDFSTILPSKQGNNSVDEYPVSY